MKIIAGTLKGRNWKVKGRQPLRPACERVRESVFSILGEQVGDAVVFDLFAGTGSMGLEALSRGARALVLVESDRQRVASLRAVVEAWGVADRVRLIAAPVEKSLRRLPGAADLIFIDPPYGYGAWEQLLQQVGKNGLLAADGQVMIETRDKDDFVTGSGWEETDRRAYGDILIRFLRECR